MTESEKQLNAELHKSLMQSLTDALKAAKASSKSRPKYITSVKQNGPVFQPIDPLKSINQAGKRPWERAMSIVHDLQARRICNSSVRSAHVIRSPVF